MKSIFRATAVLGTSSAVSIASGLISAKASASFLGPRGVGYLGVLQSLYGLAVLVASMGIGTGLVRAGAAYLAAGDLERLAALRRAALVLTAALALISFALLVVFRQLLVRSVLGSTLPINTVVLVALATIFALFTTQQTSTLNLYHRIGPLAKAAIVTTIASTSATVFMIWKWRVAAIGPTLLVSSVLGWLVATYYLYGSVGRLTENTTRPAVLNEGRDLLRFGGPYTGSMLVGAGIQMAVPLLVLHGLGATNVGYYRAASAVAVAYLGFLLSAMAQDYYPRLSAVREEPAAVEDLVNKQHRLVMLLGAPMILVTLALVPYLIPVVYSTKFLPASAMLEWQLIGDILKFSSWTLSFVILVRSSSATYFLMESIAGIATVVATWIGMHVFGLAGLGLAYVASYVVYYVTVYVLSRRDMPIHFSVSNRVMLILALASAVAIRLSSYVGSNVIRDMVAFVLAAAWVLYCGRAILAEMRGGRALLASP